METLINLLLLFAGIILGAVVISAIAILGMYSWQRARRMNAAGTKGGADKANAKGGIAEKVKKAVALRPALLVTLAAVALGWLFLLFSVLVLLPSWWQWLLAYPEFLWMPPLAIFAAQILYVSKKEPAKYLAHAIVLVLFIAFVTALPWWWRNGGESAGTTRSATEQTTVSAPAQRWQGCIPLPLKGTGTRTTVTETLFAPVGAESPCYLIRDGYWFRITPKSPGTTVRLAWQDGRVLNITEKRAETDVVQLGSIRNVAFSLTSIGASGKSAKVIVGLEKK